MTKAIARILFEQWDPLGVKDMAPTDEYDEYARVIGTMLGRGESGSDVRAYLSRTRRDLLQAPEDVSTDDRVAQTIMAASHG